MRGNNGVRLESEEATIAWRSQGMRRLRLAAFLLATVPETLEESALAYDYQLVLPSIDEQLTQGWSDWRSSHRNIKITFHDISMRK